MFFHTNSNVVHWNFFAFLKLFINKESYLFYLNRFNHLYKAGKTQIFRVFCQLKFLHSLFFIYSADVILWLHFLFGEKRSDNTLLVLYGFKRSVANCEVKFLAE